MVFLSSENLSFDVHRDLARKIAARDRGRHLGDVAHLRREIGGEQVDVVGQVLPGTGDARHDRLSAEATFRADLARNARHLRRKRAELIDHRIDRFLELQDLAAHVDGDLLRQVAARHRDGDLRDIAHLGRQIAGHQVHALGEVLPDAGHLAHLRLAAQLAVGAHLARDARHLRGEHAQLLDHGVDDRRRAQEFAFQRPAVDVEAHGHEQVALGHRFDGSRHLGCRPQQIVDQGVDGILHLPPGSGRQAQPEALAGPSFLADDLTHLLQLLRYMLVGRDDFIEGVGDLAEDARRTPRPCGRKSRPSASPAARGAIHEARPRGRRHLPASELQGQLGYLWIGCRLQSGLAWSAPKARANALTGDKKRAIGGRTRNSCDRQRR